MQRPCTPSSRVLNYSSSEIIHRTITSYTGTTIHQFSFVIPHPLLPYLLSRIVREKMPCLTPFSSLFSVTWSWAPRKPAKNSCSLQCGGSSEHKIWLFSFLEVEHPVLLIIQPSSGWWHFPVSWHAKILHVGCQQNWGKWEKIFWHIWLVKQILKLVI